MSLLHLLKRLIIKTIRRIRVTRSIWETQKDGPTSRSRFLAYIWIPVIDKNGIAVKASVNGRSGFISPRDYFDLEVWRDIFHDRDYADTYIGNPRVIFDLGAHIGISSLYYHLRYPDAQVYSFEADPSNFEYLERNIASYQPIQAFNYAVVGNDRPVHLFVHKRSVSHSLVERSANGNHVEVMGKSLDSILQELGISKVDLIKFNIEGSEYEVFRDFKALDTVDYFTGKLHADIIDRSEKDFLDLFPNHETKLEQTRPQRYRFQACRR